MLAEEKSELRLWLVGQRQCAVCWWPEMAYGREMHVHHMMGGFSRSKGNDKRNYLLLCDRCHGVFHSGKVYALTPDINKRTLLWAKQDSDPDNYDPAYLAVLKNKKHLGYDPEPPDQYYLDERRQNICRFTLRL